MKVSLEILYYVLQYIFVYMNIILILVYFVDLTALSNLTWMDWPSSNLRVVMDSLLVSLYGVYKEYCIYLYLQCLVCFVVMGENNDPK